MFIMNINLRIWIVKFQIHYPRSNLEKPRYLYDELQFFILFTFIQHGNVYHIHINIKIIISKALISDYANKCRKLLICSIFRIIHFIRLISIEKIEFGLTEWMTDMVVYIFLIHSSSSWLSLWLFDCVLFYFYYYYDNTMKMINVFAN